MVTKHPRGGWYSRCSVMLPRLRVDGFKSLVGVDVRFAPFTCVAGANGAGKSNLFDVITFLSDLAHKPLLEAAMSVRAEEGRAGNVRALFHRAAEHRATRIELEAEMVIPRTGLDDLGQEAKATTTFLRYRLILGWDESDLAILHESLEHVQKAKARRSLAFPHRREFRDSLGIGRRTGAFLSTEVDGRETYIKLHQDAGPGTGSGGRPRRVLAARLPRTVLSTTTAAESPTALLARREMESWRLLQLEPSALRAPDSYNAPARIDSHGAHMPATLARLTRMQQDRVPSSRSRHPPAGDSADDDIAAVYARIANRLAQLISGVRGVSIDADDRREILTLFVTDESQTRHEARALSDGTLRFLALAILEGDSEAQGLLCLEEPENGIHPLRVEAMLHLLQDLAVDPDRPVGPGNPLRQVIVNTHSPQVVAQLPEQNLVVARVEPIIHDGQRVSRTSFACLDGTWRHRAEPAATTLALGDVLGYLDPLGPSRVASRAGSQRVMDRKDVQTVLPFLREPATEG